MTAPDDSPGAVVVRRVIPVARERVFAAWLDPASLARWMRPGGTLDAAVEVEARIGGGFRIVMRHASGAVEHTGEYLVIDPPARLSFTWRSTNTDNRATVVTVELHQHPSGTELVLTHRGLPPRMVEAHRKGWTDIARHLEADLASGTTA